MTANGTAAATTISVNATNSTSGTISANATAFAGTVDSTGNATASAAGISLAVSAGIPSIPAAAFSVDPPTIS